MWAWEYCWPSKWNKYRRTIKVRNEFVVFQTIHSYYAQSRRFQMRMNAAVNIQYSQIKTELKSDKKTCSICMLIRQYITNNKVHTLCYWIANDNVISKYNSTNVYKSRSLQSKYIKEIKIKNQIRLTKAQGSWFCPLQ